MSDETLRTALSTLATEKQIFEASIQEQNVRKLNEVMLHKNKIKKKPGVMLLVRHILNRCIPLILSLKCRNQVQQQILLRLHLENVQLLIHLKKGK